MDAETTDPTSVYSCRTWLLRMQYFTLYCHTWSYLEISAQLKIQQDLACKSGIIIIMDNPPTNHPPGHTALWILKVEYLDITLLDQT